MLCLELHKAQIKDPSEKLVWTLLQATGFLDMEKLIEHRPPLDKLGFWKRPAIPQRAYQLGWPLSAVDSSPQPLTLL